MIIDRTLIEYSLDKMMIVFVTDEGKNLIKSLHDKPRNKCVQHLLHNIFSTDLLQICSNFKMIYLKCHELYHILHNKKHLLNQNNLLNIEDQQDENYDEFDEFDELRESDEFDELQSIDSVQLNPETKNDSKQTISLKKDVKTRFFSSSPMLNSIISNRSNIKQALIELDKLNCYPTDEQWRLMDAFNDLLKEINNYVKILSQHKSPTQHLVLVYRCEILDLISNFDLFDLKEKNKLIKKFNDKFIITEIQVAAALLHPKLIYLKPIDEFLDQKKMNRCNFLIKIIEKYKINNDINSKLNLDLPNLVLKHSNIPITASTLRTEIESEIQSYISTEFSNSNLNENSNLLEYWNHKIDEYPHLKKLSDLLLCTPAGQNKTERSFWKIKLNAQAIRNRISDMNLDRHIFINENIEFVRKICSNDKNFGFLNTNQEDSKKRKSDVLLLEVEREHNKKLKRYKNKKEKIVESNVELNFESDVESNFKDENIDTNQMEEYKERMNSLEKLIEKDENLIDINNDDDIKKSNDLFDELGFIYNQLKIVKQNQIIMNDDLIDTFQLVDSIEEITDKKKHLVISSEIFFDSNRLISHLNKFYEKESSFIFIPVNKRNHWFLLIIDITGSKTIIIDSLIQSDTFYRESCQQAFNLIQLIFKIEKKVLKKKSFFLCKRRATTI